MEKTFNFGTATIGGKEYKIRVTAELQRKNGNLVFTASGEIVRTNRDFICGGQCLDTIAEYTQDPIFLEIFNFWNLYHLNDMHAECKHQRELGWLEKAGQSVTVYHWYISDDAGNQKKAAEKRAMEALKNGESFTPTAEETFFSKFPNFIETFTPETPENYRPHIDYNTKKQKIETKTLGMMYAPESSKNSMTEKAHPDGILCKPCPVCGYEYGSSCVYMPIPENDLNRIRELLK